ncbi:SDR family oxidoreductase [Pseudomonas syringae]|uniref:SDR family oxidoreductase n=2 Tax=Pseudomonas syringae group TaxID=136849 RepID=A0A9Q4FGV6_PSESX|nr:SDR family oxidoreductase [Pseudomonas syringae]KTB57093.1 short-chain dehydrogenase [Pseudomonas viridiflava ICMP 13104]KTB86264.1 short-chain dehydrogenase [Pseudomonas syringae pv. syringae PD2766]MCF5468349.1 SDR family oxidoreductase [Pseudomonas syringae]MCF5472873.1 SDR family oxidoreductase [Pseudomonas syringae]MCF5482888.1 SDR family oxidoreductase [Pseudomonas syringae]
MRLSETKVVLTGASGGIGLEIAEALCRQGAHVLAVSRRQQPLRRLLAQYPAHLHWVEADLCTAQGRTHVVRSAVALQGVNLLINAAGTNHFAMLEQLSAPDIESMLTINVHAPILLTSLMLPVLKQASQAMVVNVGSTYGSIGHAGYATYCASKFALRGFSEALRRELADTNVGVLYVAPRATQTGMNSPAAQALNDALSSAVDDPQDVARAVLNAIAGGRRELYLGWPERFFVRLNSILPTLVDRGLRKHLPLIRHLSTPAPEEKHIP